MGFWCPLESEARFVGRASHNKENFWTTIHEPDSEERNPVFRITLRQRDEIMIRFKLIGSWSNREDLTFAIPLARGSRQRRMSNPNFTRSLCLPVF